MGGLSESPGDAFTGALLGVDDVEGNNVVITLWDVDGNCQESILTHSTPGAGGTAAYVGFDADNMKFTLYGMDVDMHWCGFPNLECTYTGNFTGDVNNVSSTVVFSFASIAAASGFPCPGNWMFTATYQLTETGTGNLFGLVN